MPEKLNIDYARALYENNGLVLLSDQYINNKIKMLAACMECSYEWPICLDKVSTGRGCPRCKKCLKYTLRDAHLLAESKHGQCLSDEFHDVHSLLEWLCGSCGWKWFATFHHVQDSTWCPRCRGGAAIRDLTECHIVAESHNGQCLSESYESAHSYLSWMCDKGHIWNATYASVCLSDSWCPKCCKKKNQKLLAEILHGQFPNCAISFEFNGFDWLKTEAGGKQSFDIYIADLKLAVEYDGAQHFRPVCFGGISLERAQENYESSLRRDAIKNEKVLSHPEDIRYFIRFKYDEPLTIELVQSRLLAYGVI